MLLTAVTTNVPKSLGEGGATGANGTEETFQKYRALYIQGYARSKKSDEAAIAIVRGYADTLGRIEQLFDGVEIVELDVKLMQEADYWKKPFTLKAYIKEGPR